LKIPRLKLGPNLRESDKIEKETLQEELAKKKTPKKVLGTRVLNLGPVFFQKFIKK